MDTPLVIRPKPWLLVAAIMAVVLAPTALAFVPNPFEGLSPDERPVRFLMFLWVALPLMALAALWRLLTWTTYRATQQSLEERNVFGAKHLPWNEMTATELETPVGMPPAYELRFGKYKVRFIAAHHDRTKIHALKDLISR